MIAQLAIVLGALLAAWGLALIAARLGVLRITITRPARPRPPKEPAP